MTLEPLAGIRVLDFTMLPPGGAATVLLADLGAEIIRVESPALKGRPSLVVQQVPLSRAKRSITLDLRNPASVDVLLRLATTVDVVVENAKPGAMEQRGFGYRQARDANPGIIWCAITGFGQDGPNADHAGHDLSYVAHSGMMSALSATMPWQPGTMLSVPSAALAAIIGIQSALLLRARSGQGAFLDISLTEAMGWFLTCAINPFSATPMVLTGAADRMVYECRDGGFVAIACAEPRTWTALCDGLDLPHLKDALHQRERNEEAKRALADAFRTRAAHAWVDALAPSGAAISVVNRGAETLDDAHVRARQSILRCGDTPVPANPVRLAAADGERSGTNLAPPPITGADTEAVLAAAGFGAADIAAMAAAGLI